MATRTVTKILADIVAAFRVRCPHLQGMGLNFTKNKLYLGQTAIAHIEQLPSLADYDANNGGYRNGATSMDALLVDIPVTIDGHKHVPVKLAHLANISNEKKYRNAVGNQAFVLGKYIGDTLLAKVRGSSISFEKVVASNAIDLDDLNEITGTMNINGANPVGRRGIVATAVMNTLVGDSRIASKDYLGQMPGANGLRRLTNIAGFEYIDEYPDLDNNNADGQTFTAAATDICTAVGHGFVTGDKVRVTTTAADLPAGLAIDTTYYVIRLSADTFKLATSDANATAGQAVDIADAGTGVHTIAGWENLTGFFYEERAFALYTGVPNDSSEACKELGIPEVMRYKAVQDPETGLALAALMWQEPGVTDLYCTVAALWGSAVGRQGGAAEAITDRAGFRLVSAG